MKIGMILDKVYPPDPRIENEATYLIEQGHEVFLYAFTFEDKSSKHWVHKGIKVTNYPMPSWLTKAYALAYTIPWYHHYIKTSLRHFILSQNFDAIHVHDMQIARAVFWLKDIIKGKIVLDLHENRPEIMKYYEHVNSSLGKLSIFPSQWRKYEYKYIKEADKVVVVTEEAADHYCNYLAVHKEKFIVIPNTVKKQFYEQFDAEKNPKSRTPFRLLYIGDTGSRRGLETIFAALKQLDDEDIVLDIVGTSRYDKTLKEVASELGLRDKVIFHGWQDFTLFPKFINEAHVGLSPIHRNVHHDTTFANKIFQYLSFGKPIIASDCPPQVNIVNKYKVGCVAKDQNVADYADKIKRLKEDSDFYHTCSNNAYTMIREEWNWENKARGLSDYYRQL